jgi:fructokinase
MELYQTVSKNARWIYQKSINVKEEAFVKYDVVALGELLIDFTENGTSGQGNPLFEANPGGAPCNVLAMLAKLGHKTAFIGKVGRDFFGEQLKTAIEEVGIDRTYIRMDDKVPTTLAFVHTLQDGDREFSFYRNPGADVMLTEDEIPEELIESTKIFHFGTLSMTHEEVRKATRKALETAKKAGVLISFDPNLRPSLWEDMEVAREQVLYGLKYCDVLKIADNEIQWLTGEEDYTNGVQWICQRFDIPLILVSLGKEGSRAYYQDQMIEAAPFLQKNTIETTGAGDTFAGCVLHYLCEHELMNLDKKNIEEMLQFANAAASIITTKKGALRLMPEAKEVLKLIEETK